MERVKAQSTVLLEPGTLWPAVVRRAEHALRCGALEPIETESRVVEDGGIPFVVHQVASLERKARARRLQTEGGGNPFLPYDEDLFVADLTPTHVCLLNRFKVVDHHILIVTRELEDQESPLGLRDFEALWVAMAEVDGLGFYNSGEVAGASQPHKHLQLVPVPLGAGPERAPMDRALATARYDGEVGRVEALPFLHAAARLDPALPEATPVAAAFATWGLYRSLLGAVFQGRPVGPYNLLVTREHMLLVPRSEGAWESIEVNALGYAGSLLVRRREQMETVQRLGPLALLRRVGEEGCG